jgi:hypothetical protein
VFWGWKLAVRDVSAVPVVLALEGPMRVAPDTPGAAEIPHQGLAVNAVQEARGATPVPDQVRVLEEPETLTAEDMARADPVAPQDRAEQTLALVDRLVAEVVAEGAQMQAIAEGAQMQAIAEGAQMESIAEGAQLETVSRSPATPLPNLPVAAVLVQAPVPGGLGRSPRPVIRPASMPVARTEPADGPEMPQVASIAPGSRLVQLGAFDSAATADAAWDKLIRGAFAPLMEDKARVVQEARSGGRTFYRLRAAGFTDLDDSRRFCAALQGGGVDCIPVVAR